MTADVESRPRDSLTDFSADAEDPLDKRGDLPEVSDLMEEIERAENRGTSNDARTMAADSPEDEEDELI